MKIYKHFSFNVVENYTYKSHKIFRVVFKYQYLSIFEEKYKIHCDWDYIVANNLFIIAFKFLLTEQCLSMGKLKYYKTGGCELSVHVDLNYYL